MASTSSAPLPTALRGVTGSVSTTTTCSAGWDEPVPGFPDTGVRHKLDPAELGLEYEAYHVPRDAYFSDSAFIDRRRAHPSSVRLPPAGRTIALIHPCHWDASMAGKAVRLARRLAARLRRGR